MILSFVFSLDSQTESQEKIFVEYNQLNPIVSSIENISGPENRRLYYYKPNGKTIKEDSLLRYDPANGEERMLSLSRIEGYPVKITEAFWGYNEGFNYCYINKGYDAITDVMSGWNKLFVSEHDIINMRPLNYYAPPLRTTPLIVKMDDGHVLYSETVLAPFGRKDENFKIIDSNTEKIIWSYSCKENYFATNIYWIGGNWLFMENSAFGGGSIYGVNHTIFNYLTGEDRSFYPEIIIGFGKGYIATTTKELIGITIWDMENQIVFRDNTFEMAGMLETYYSKILDFGYIDIPYVYYTVYSGNTGNTTRCSVILKLNTGKTYMTITAWNLLGVF
jgi:hypothetical protein